MSEPAMLRVRLYLSPLGWMPYSLPAERRLAWVHWTTFADQVNFRTYVYDVVQNFPVIKTVRFATPEVAQDMLAWIRADVEEPWSVYGKEALVPSGEWKCEMHFSFASVTEATHFRLAF